MLRSILGAETYSFPECFEPAFTIQDEPGRAIARKIPIAMLANSAYLFNVTEKSSATAERRLMNDLAATKKICSKMDIDDLGCIRTNDNIADSSTKKMPNKVLNKFLTTGFSTQIISQWVVRDKFLKNATKKTINKKKMINIEEDERLKKTSMTKMINIGKR